MRKEGRERWRKEGRDNRQKRRGRKREEKWNVAGFDSGNSGGKGNGRRDDCNADDDRMWG